MASIRRLARAGAFAAGAVLVGLSVAGFDLPTPLPTISPAVPMPTPSLLPIPNLLNQSSSGQPAGSSAPVQQGPGHTSPTSAGGSSLPAGALAGRAAAAPPAGGAGDSRQPAATAGAQSASSARPAAALPVTGGSPPGPGAPLPIAPATLAASLLALFFVAVRLRTPSSAARRYRIRIDFGASVGPAGAAAIAVRSLLEGELPAGARLRAHGEGAFLLEAPMLQRAVLAARLAEAARRARRVGLSLSWSPTPLTGDQADRESVVALSAYRLQSS